MQATDQTIMGRYMLYVLTHGELVNRLFFQWFCHKKILKDMISYSMKMLPWITNHVTHKIWPKLQENSTIQMLSYSHKTDRLLNWHIGKETKAENKHLVKENTVEY